MTLTSVELVLRVAFATEGASEIPANTNRGPFVERCQRVTGNSPGDAWCQSYVSMIGVAALGHAWPLPRTGSCQELADFALAKKIVRETPAIGDVFLIWHAKLSRFAHAGFIVGPANDTLSGNTSGAGSREGWIVGRRTWSFTPSDRYVRWAELVGSI